MRPNWTKASDPFGMARLYQSRALTQGGENDLWMCAQAKERDLTLVTAERRMKRISDADPEVRILRV